jgi:hypothetical protein
MLDAHRHLASLYEEWRLMSESEGDAIRSLAWQRIEHCQSTKAGLRERIVRIVENAGGGEGFAEDLGRRFRPVLEHLIRLEQRNSEWLAAERRKLETEREGLNRDQRSIRRLQGAYGMAGAL